MRSGAGRAGASIWPRGHSRAGADCYFSPGPRRNRLQPPLAAFITLSEDPTIEVGILGATGFTGGELVGFLLRHPEATLAWLSSESQPGTDYAQVYPRFLGRLPAGASVLKSLDEVRSSRPDVVFSCLPHGASGQGRTTPIIAQSSGLEDNNRENR